jgi:hypothetical protein
MARRIAEGLGLRTEILAARQSGDGIRRLHAGEVDLVLAPPVTRGLLREIMFCTPHLSMDLVLVARGMRGHAPRGLAGLLGMRLATLSVLAPALADRGVLGALPAVMPLATPWLLVRALLDGTMDGIIVTNVMARAMLRSFPEPELRVGLAMATSVFAGAVAYGAHDLLRAVNSVIDQLQLDDGLAGLFRQETGLPFIRPYPN